VAPPPKKGSPGAPEAPKTPWTARGVAGVVPPGRRLGEAGEKRRATWSASGVAGITPPGNQKPGEGPAARWAIAKSKGESPTKLAVPKKGKGEPSLAPARPTAGFVPDLRAAEGDPKDLKTFLDLFAEAHSKIALDAETASQLAQLVGQSHAPFEIMVAFTWLSAWVGSDGARRKEYQRVHRSPAARPGAQDGGPAVLRLAAHGVPVPVRVRGGRVHARAGAAARRPRTQPQAHRAGPHAVCALHREAELRRPRAVGDVPVEAAGLGAGQQVSLPQGIRPA